MKLIIAIVQDDDASDVIETLTDENYRVTKLSTTGGFLKSGNTTLMTGVKEDEVKNVLKIIKDICKERKEMMITPSSLSSNEGAFMNQYPVQINVGGATIFILDVDQFIKI
ncbi:cyclic-di-AMP receptor [Clostridium sp. BJN0001]|uniref:cyclic-di-AMP receptor n=1 Tax=Clostridium sp. BJN0001 TaxID=2930219 RepID=UPI001FD37E98|nr:cyclic-di-AMP receptor [Clostridium sp. BJN0001]